MPRFYASVALLVAALTILAHLLRALLRPEVLFAASAVCAVVGVVLGLRRGKP